MLLDGIRLGEVQQHVTKIQIAIARMQKARSQEAVSGSRDSSSAGFDDVVRSGRCLLDLA